MDALAIKEASLWGGGPGKRAPPDANDVLQGNQVTWNKEKPVTQCCCRLPFGRKAEVDLGKSFS